MEISRPINLHLKRSQVWDSLLVIEKFIQSKCRSQRVRLELQCEEALPDLWLDENLFQRCCLDLALHALENTPMEGQLALEARRSGSATVELRICNSGPGFKEKELPHIFDPFFLGTKKSGGLGLFNVRRICHEMGIEASASNLDGSGKPAFVLVLQIGEEPAPPIRNNQAEAG
jgi:signal transduction histidine kinase